MEAQSMSIEELVADIHEQQGFPGAAISRWRARDERAALVAENVYSADTLDAFYGLLREVPEPSKSTKHDETCWRKHAHCLAAHIARTTGMEL